MARPRKLRIQPLDNQPSLFDLNSEPSNPLSRHHTADKVGGDDLDVFPGIKDFALEHQKHTATTVDTKAEIDLSIDPEATRRPEPITFLSFGSGSSGNSAYIGDSTCGILIDAGVDADFVIKSLADNGLSIDNVRGILITHDHSDHVRFVYKLIRRRTDLAVFCTPKTLSGMLRRHSLSRRIKDYHHPIYKEFTFKIGNFEITPFEVSHDGTDNVGFFIANGEHRFAVATDLGCITDRVDHYMRQAQYIMIESNYDLRMLNEGDYPYYLKSRIKAANGHLDNSVTAQFIADIITDRLKYIFLCHLSKDNNTPEIALREIHRALGEKGITNIGDGSNSLTAREAPLQILALPRFACSNRFTLR